VTDKQFISVDRHERQRIIIIIRSSHRDVGLRARLRTWRCSCRHSNQPPWNHLHDSKHLRLSLRICCPRMWSRNKINSVLATIYFTSAPSVRACRAEINVLASFLNYFLNYYPCHLILRLGPPCNIGSNQIILRLI